MIQCLYSDELCLILWFLQRAVCVVVQVLEMGKRCRNLLLVILTDWKHNDCYDIFDIFSF